MISPWKIGAKRMQEKGALQGSRWSQKVTQMVVFNENSFGLFIPILFDFCKESSLRYYSSDSD